MVLQNKFVVYKVDYTFYCMIINFETVDNSFSLCLITSICAHMLVLLSRWSCFNQTKIKDKLKSNSTELVLTDPNQTKVTKQLTSEE